MVVTTFSPRPLSRPGAAVLSLVLAAAAGTGVAFSPYYTAGAVIGLAVLALTFTLPERALLFGFVILTLSGFRPLPPILGFHIQGQYLLVIPLLLRALAARPPDEASVAPWRPLVRASIVVAVAGTFAYLQDVGNHDPALTSVTGDFLTWVIAFVFLGVFVRLARPQGPRFAATLYRDLVDALGLFAAFTLITGLMHFHSFSAASTARLSLADLNPNETGVIVGVAIMLNIVPLAIRGARPRDFIWLPFLAPLLVLTGSRESLFAVGVGFVALLFHLRALRATVRYIYVFLGLGVAVLFVLSNFQSVVPHSLLRSIYFPEITPYLTIAGFHVPPALAERIYIQSTAFHEFLQHPLLGVGFNRGISVPEGMNAPGWWGPPLILRVGHDSFVTVAGQQGLIGLIPFLALIVVAFRTTGKSVRRTRTSGEGYDLAVGARIAILVLVVASFNIDALYLDFKVMTVFFWVLVVALLLQTPAPEMGGAASPAAMPAAGRRFMRVVAPVTRLVPGTGARRTRPLA